MRKKQRPGGEDVAHPPSKTKQQPSQPAPAAGAPVAVLKRPKVQPSPPVAVAVTHPPEAEPPVLVPPKSIEEIRREKQQKKGSSTTATTKAAPILSKPTRKVSTPKQAPVPIVAGTSTGGADPIKSAAVASDEALINVEGVANIDVDDAMLDDLDNVDMGALDEDDFEAQMRALEDAL